MKQLLWIVFAFLYSLQMNGQQRQANRKDSLQLKKDTPDVLNKVVRPPDTSRYDEQRKRDSLQKDDRRPKRNTRTKEDSLRF